MGKKGGTSWLTAVKRAFRSPTKDSNRRRDDHHDQEEDEDKVTDWLLLNFTFHIFPIIHFCFWQGNTIFFSGCFTEERKTTMGFQKTGESGRARAGEYPTNPDKGQAWFGFHNDWPCTCDDAGGGNRSEVCACGVGGEGGGSEGHRSGGGGSGQNDEAFESS